MDQQAQNLSHRPIIALLPAAVKAAQRAPGRVREGGASRLMHQVDLSPENRISSIIRGKAPERHKKLQILHLADKCVE
jgi:hypothetical protein